MNSAATVVVKYIIEIWEVKREIVLYMFILMPFTTQNVNFGISIFVIKSYSAKIVTDCYRLFEFIRGCLPQKVVKTRRER